jgi:hypothetical protein
VEDQSIKAAADDSARGRALGFIMAMLQRRFASSIYVVRRSLERMREKREKILADPEKYRQDQITQELPEDLTNSPKKNSRKSSPNWRTWWPRWIRPRCGRKSSNSAS